jgi:hypothetical protein
VLVHPARERAGYARQSPSPRAVQATEVVFVVVAGAFRLPAWANRVPRVIENCQRRLSKYDHDGEEASHG